MAVAAGNDKLMERLGVDCAAPATSAGHHRPRGRRTAAMSATSSSPTPVKPDAAEAHCQALKARRRAQDRHAHRRPRGAWPSRWPRELGMDEVPQRNCCPRTRSTEVEELLAEQGRQGQSWPSWATASTTRRCSPARTSASPWAPWARTPPSRPPTWSSWTTSPSQDRQGHPHRPQVPAHRLPEHRVRPGREAGHPRWPCPRVVPGGGRMQRAAKGRPCKKRLLAGRVPALMAALVVICLAGVLLTLGEWEAG